MKSRLVIGIHSCREVFAVRPKSVVRLVLREGWERSEPLQDLREMASRQKSKIEVMSSSYLDKWGSGHQGVGLETSETPGPDWAQIYSKQRSLILALDGIEDPHNLGAILRTGWLMAIDAVILPKDRAVSLTATACKVASGGAEHVPIEVVTNLAAFLKELEQKGFWIFGLSEEAEKDVWDLKVPDKVVLVLGAEGAGLRQPVARACNELLQFYQSENVKSEGATYNVSVCAALAAAEVRRQWR